MKKLINTLPLAFLVFLFLYGCSSAEEGMSEDQNNLVVSPTSCTVDSDCVLRNDRCGFISVNKGSSVKDYVGSPCRENFFQGPFDAVCVDGTCIKEVNCEKFCQKTNLQDELNWYYTLSKEGACDDYETKFALPDLELVKGICDNIDVCTCQ